MKFQLPIVAEINAAIDAMGKGWEVVGEGEAREFVAAAMADWMSKRPLSETWIAALRMQALLEELRK